MGCSALLIEKGKTEMRILNEDNNSAIKNLTILLEYHEATELFDSLSAMIKDCQKHEHEHINDKEYEHEITIAIYDENNISTFNPRMVQLIKEDK
ncbi:hypothetical protein LJC20_07075 [Eubacteriales bacterium OttesenSCG-928-M02]|nr:hypothetical protein [Eubacteriales bacterium OttesenSCG-928-M02]